MTSANGGGGDRTEDWRSSSVWAEALHRQFGPVTSDRTVDVVVVGAGIAGLVTATVLSRSGADVLVVDRHEVGGVATRNTTAKVDALQGTRYQEILHSRGADVAAAYAAAQVDAVTGIRRLVADLDVDCACTEAPAFTYATDADGERHASAELEAAGNAGLPVRWVTETELPFPSLERSDSTTIALRPGPILPRPRRSARKGPRRRGHHRAHHRRNPRRLHRDHGRRSGRIVGSRRGRNPRPDQRPGPDREPLPARAALALAAQIAADVPTGLYLSSDRQVRSLPPDRRGDDRLLVVGGEGHPVGDAEAGPERWDALEASTTDHFGSAHVSHRWATRDLIASDNVPFIGRLAGPQRRWVATGFTKWGMTNSYVAARIISKGSSATRRRGPRRSTPPDSHSTVDPTFLTISATATRHLVVDRVAQHQNRDAPIKAASSDITTRWEPRTAHAMDPLRRRQLRRARARHRAAYSSTTT